MAIDHLQAASPFENVRLNLEKLSNMREIEHGIVNAAKTKEGYECAWCRRTLQQPAGLLRHRDYCPWNPAIRRSSAAAAACASGDKREYFFTRKDCTKIILLQEFCFWWQTRAALRFCSRVTSIVAHSSSKVIIMI